MSIHPTERNLRQRMHLAGSWRPSDAAEMRLFDASHRVSDSARSLEAASGQLRSAGATDVSLDALCTAFEALANSALLMRESATSELADSTHQNGEREGLQELEALLFGVVQNLRFAAHGCQLSRDALDSLPEST